MQNRYNWLDRICALERAEKTPAKLLSGFRVKALSSDSREGKTKAQQSGKSVRGGERREKKTKRCKGEQRFIGRNLAKLFRYNHVKQCFYWLSFPFFIGNILRVQESWKWEVAHGSNLSFGLNRIMRRGRPGLLWSLPGLEPDLGFSALTLVLPVGSFKSVFALGTRAASH